MKESVAASVKDQVLASSDRFWGLSDFKLAPHAATTALSRLEKAGELDRVRRGVYWRGRKTRFGTVGAPAVEAVRRMLSDSEAFGAAGWYATNLLKLSTQVSPVPVVAVTARPPSGLHNVLVVDRSGRRGRRDAKLNETEVTFLEALEAWDNNVELSNIEAFNRFVEILGGGALRAERLVEASTTESSRVRERLRAVLYGAGWRELANRVEGARSPSSKERARAVLPAGAFV